MHACHKISKKQFAIKTIPIDNNLGDILKVCKASLFYINFKRKQNTCWIVNVKIL